MLISPMLTLVPSCDAVHLSNVVTRGVGRDFVRPRPHNQINAKRLFRGDQMSEPIAVKLACCNNIDRATITLKPNATTVLHGMNGSGKSSVAKAIQLYNGDDRQALEVLKPYASESLPSVEGLPEDANILVFNEDYVDSTLFKGDMELIENGYKIFVDTPEYRKAAKVTDELLADAVKRLRDEGKVVELLSTVNNLLSCFGKVSKQIYSKTSPIAKGVVLNGNLVEHVSPKFESFTSLIQGGNAKEWLLWRGKGDKFSSLGVCPYCGKTLEQSELEICNEMQAAYGGKYIDSFTKTIQTFGEAEVLLSENARAQADAILHGKLEEEPNPENEAFLACIKADAEGLKAKLEKIQQLNYSFLKNEEKDADYFEGLKIHVERLEKMNSQFAIERVNSINAVLDDLSSKVREIQGAIGRQSCALRKSINASMAEMNAFLESAGFPYEISIASSDGARCTVSLKPRGLEMNVENLKSHLSYGERNSLAIALFSAQVKSEKPDIVVLDDPISSFDQNKKYAILQRLFSKSKGVCNGITTLLLTHDFETLIMIGKVHKTLLCDTSCFYVRNDDGNLTLIPVENDDFNSAVQCFKAIVASDASLPYRIALARRAVEIAYGKSSAWHVLSSLAHQREVATQNGQELTDEEWKEAKKQLKDIGLKDFSYQDLLSQLGNKELLSVYDQAPSPVERICAFRLLAANNADEMRQVCNRAHVDDTVFKFANEYFHIENLMAYQFDPVKFNTVPAGIIETCDKVIARFKGEYGQQAKADD